jgi:hypothetical protein
MTWAIICPFIFCADLLALLHFFYFHYFSDKSSLHYRDVIILSTRLNTEELQDCFVELDTLQTSGFISGLQAEGLPVCVVHKASHSALLPQVLYRGKNVMSLIHRVSTINTDISQAAYERNLRDFALADKDAISVTSIHYVKGMERRVVVSVAD